MNSVDRNPSARSWYVVHTRSRAENQAVTHLLNQSFDVFFPRIRKTRRHARRIDEIIVPAFPGYLFVRLNLYRDSWRPINGTYGVIRLVAISANRPQAVANEIVEVLLARCEEGILVRGGSQLSVGQRVKLLSGPFAEQIGKIETLNANGRVRLLMQMMGGSTRVEADQKIIVSANMADFAH